MNTSCIKTKSMKKIVFIVFMILTVQLHASEPESIYSEAEKAYSEGQYNNAIELYMQLLSLGYESANLYYNLGNACYKINDYASSILYFEKALKRDPGNPKIIHNLKVANAKIIDKIDAIPRPFYSKWPEKFRNIMNMDAWAISGLVFLMFFFIALSAHLMMNSVRHRKISLALTIVFILFSAASAYNAWGHYTGIKNSRSAIIFEQTVNVRSSPDENSKDIFVIHEGTKVNITDRLGDWIEIKIANGSDGWIPYESVREI